MIAPITIAQPARCLINTCFLCVIPMQRFFAACLMGRRRHYPFRHSSRQVHKSLIRSFLLLGGTALLSLVLALLGVLVTSPWFSRRSLVLSRSAISTPTPISPRVSKVHPTALPWIETETECTGQTRQWRDGLCFDSEHDPTF